MRKPGRGDLQSPAGVNPSVLKAPDEVVEGEENQQVELRKRFESPGDQLKASLAQTELVALQARQLGGRAIKRSVRSPLTGEHVCRHAASTG